MNPIQILETIIIHITSLNKHFYFELLKHIQKYSHNGGWRKKVETLWAFVLCLIVNDLICLFSLYAES